jgi:hypothetical protein
MVSGIDGIVIFIFILLYPLHDVQNVVRRVLYTPVDKTSGVVSACNNAQ